MTNDELDILYDENTIREKVGELAAAISRDYAGRDVVLIGILKGAAVFLADLARKLTIPVELDFVRASSYGTSTASSGEVVIGCDAATDIRGRHILLVDTIIDTGGTLRRLLDHFEKKGPASLKTVVLMDKRPRRSADTPLGYVGFEIADVFVVGYGVDCAERYRNLPYVAVVKPT